MHKLFPKIIMMVCLIGISYYYHYDEIMFKKPQSVHKWRQADGASIALNYYQGGMNFFEPEIHNLTADNGTSGKGCPSEIPILYYGVALLYKIFGYHDFIYRIIITLLFLAGLTYLFKLFQYILTDAFWSVCLTLLFFTSPVLVFYGNNFLTNIPALAFSIIGLYYLIRFFDEDKRKYYYRAMSFFLLAGAFKVSALFCFIAFVIMLLMEWFRVVKFDQLKKLSKKPLFYLLPILLLLTK